MNPPRIRSRWLAPLLSVALLGSVLPGQAPAALADHTPAPASVNLVGSLEDEATGGACPEWTPDCVGAKFSPQPNNVFVFESASIPVGNYAYKVALGSWDESYGGDFQQGGSNIALNLDAARTVRFHYDHKTHYIADNLHNTVTAPRMGEAGPTPTSTALAMATAQPRRAIWLWLRAAT